MTSDYYWGTVQNNMSDANSVENNYATTDGPFGFGYAVGISSALKQCMIQQDYQFNGDGCTVNPKNCTAGFSISVWEKTVITSETFNESKTFTTDDQKYVLSTGGDEDGSPGVSIYHKGYYLGAVVSTGDKYWKVEVAGPMHNDTWSNIALRWEETGGLELFVNLQKVGHVLEGKNLPPPPKSALNPSVVMVGCHKTQANQTYRGYNNGEFDELVMWTRKLFDNETLFFLGGYEQNVSNIQVDAFKKMLQNVDLSDPAQQAAAVSIASKLTLEEPSPTVPPSPTSALGSTASSTTKATASSPTASATSATATVAPPSTEEVKKFSDKVAIIQMLTNPDKAPKHIAPAQMMNLLEPVSNIFLPSTFEKWRELQKDKSNPGSVKITADLEKWLMATSKAITFPNGSEPIFETKGQDTLVSQVVKIQVGEYMTSKNFFEFPNYANLPGIRVKWNIPYDRVAIPTRLFSDNRCSDRSLNIVSMLYDTYDNIAPTTVNPATINPKFDHEPDSRVLSVRAECDPKLDLEGRVDSAYPACNPDPDLLMKNPIRFKLEHNVKTVTLRKLQFHDNETVSEINERFCTWWNPNISDYGAWDKGGCMVLESTTDYTKCACGHFGTYTIIAEKVIAREVPDDQLWLTITKYVGYILSFIALSIYIIVIAVSGDLKEQFHLIGLNLAISVFLGAVFMLSTDLATVRNDRHTCTAIGSLIHVFYLGAGAWIFVLGHASFKAITSGVVSGRLKPYWFLAWGVPLISMGLSYLFFLHDLGLDPRCFIAWENNPKWVFFGPQIFFCAVAFIFGTIVLCNMSTPALRKDNLIDDYGSFCYGASFVLIFFAITWTLGLLAYMRFELNLNFYPIFQVFNSWTGLIIFLFIGLGSKRFRMIIAGQAKIRREMLFGNAFGTPTVTVDDRQHLRVPDDQHNKSSSAPTSGRGSPISPSGVNMTRQHSTGNDFPSRPPPRGHVAGRPGTRPSSGGF